MLAYNELIDEAKHLRRSIKRVAWDYELDWDQGGTEEGKASQMAMDIVRKEEAKDRKGKRDVDRENREEVSIGQFL